MESSKKGSQQNSREKKEKRNRSNKRREKREKTTRNLTAFLYAISNANATKFAFWPCNKRLFQQIFNIIHRTRNSCGSWFFSVTLCYRIVLALGSRLPLSYTILEIQCTRCVCVCSFFLLCSPPALSHLCYFLWMFILNLYMKQPLYFL